MDNEEKNVDLNKELIVSNQEKLGSTPSQPQTIGAQIYNFCIKEESSDAQSS